MESQEEEDLIRAPDQMEEPPPASAAGNGNGKGKGKVRLIFDEGWGIGKKIAITGVAISTAPILLPPLFIFSAFGLAFSVPFGLVFAGYACTDKIMRSLLLPPPPPPPPRPTGSEAELSLLSVKMKEEADGDVPPVPECYYYEIEETADKFDGVHVTEIYEEDGAEERAGRFGVLTWKRM